MEELHTDPNLYALEEMMINQQWNESYSEEDLDDNGLFSPIGTEIIYQFGIEN